MLGKLEDELVALIKASALGPKLRAVDGLPDATDRDAIKRWSVEAPAAYVVALDGNIDGDVVDLKFAVVLVARNSFGARAARHGVASVIGLYEMLGAAIALLNGATTESAAWQATGYQLLQDVELRNQGLHVALVSIGTQVDAPHPDDADTDLGEFLEFHADYDLQPHTPDEHQRWLDENHEQPAPDMQAHINPQEGP